MPMITPFLWFDNQAEAAANYYVSIFPHGRIIDIMRTSTGMPGLQGTVMSCHFELEGLLLIAFNGGAQFRFTEALSLFVDCDSQAELDSLWARLAEGGQALPCGWLKDKYGLCWQIIPRVLGQMLQDPDAAKSTRVMQAMLQMTKIDIAKLQQAYAGE